MAICSGIRADGGRCRGQAIGDSQWCFSHHPDYESARRRRASKGGKRGGRGAARDGRDATGQEGVMGIKEQLRRLKREAQKDMVVVEVEGGVRRIFDDDHVFREMFPT